LESKKEVTLARFIYALGITHVGEQTAYDLADHFGSLKKLEKASFDELNDIFGLGDIVAKSVHDYFKDPKNLRFLEKLKKAGVKIKVETQGLASLRGKSFVITGSLEKFSREVAEEGIRKRGGKASSSVSPTTDYLVAGENPGSKYDKAKKLGVKIISENELIKLLG